MRSSYTHTEVDVSGDLKRVISDEVLYVDREPDYIKIYVDTMLAFQGEDTQLSPYIIALCRHMTWANDPHEEFRCTVRTDKIVRNNVCKALGCSESQFFRAVQQMKKSNILIPIEIDGKELRGIYFVNPWVVGHGEWRDIKELRASFVFMSPNLDENRAAVIQKDGEIRRYLPLSEGEDGQMYLLPPGKGGQTYG